MENILLVCKMAPTEKRSANVGDYRGGNGGEMGLNESAL